jgi:hypothetical protein
MEAMVRGSRMAMVHAAHLAANEAIGEAHILHVDHYNTGRIHRFPNDFCHLLVRTL